MTNFKVKKGAEKYQKVPLKDWKTSQFIQYYYEKFEKIYGFKTHRPPGQIKIHLKQASISTLHRLEGRPKDITPSELYKEFMDWTFMNTSYEDFKVGLLSKKEKMVDFLDIKAKAILDKELGSLEDFKRQEEIRLKETQEYYRNLGMDV